MRRPKILLLAAMFAAAAPGEESRLTGPVPGFIFHSPTRSIRPIIGIPGSAYLGPAAVEGFDAASVSPLGNSALATREGRLYWVRGLDTGQPSAAVIDGAIGAVERFAWNRDGVSAAVYSADLRQTQVIRNLDSTSPSVESAQDLAAVDGVVSALAFDGKRLLLGTAAEEGGGIYLLADSSAPKLLARAANPAAFALTGGDLYLADRDRNQIWTIRDYAGDATPMLFADDRAGISSPAGLRLSRNGAQLLVANAGNRSVDALEISTRTTIRHIDLDFTPGRMEPVGSRSLALLNLGAGGEPLYLMDSGVDLAVYFVPAGREQ